MEKIAAKIVECELEKCGDVAAIHLKVDYGCQQFFTISEKVNLFKFLDFFNVDKLSKVADKYCYLIMKDYHNIVELQQFPCHGYDILTLETGEIISEFDRKEKLRIEEENKKDFKEELTNIKTEIQQEQSSPEFIRKEILRIFKQPYSNNNGLFKSSVYSWFNDTYIPKKLIEKEFAKLLKEKKIIGWGNTRAKRYANARNYRKLCKTN